MGCTNPPHDGVGSTLAVSSFEIALYCGIHMLPCANPMTDNDNEGTATKAEGLTEKEWANKYFAQPLGIPKLYSNQGPDPAGDGDTPTIGAGTDVCAGGDQPITCTDFARVGQLLLNKGKWVGENDTVFEMYNQNWSNYMFTPQLPKVDDGLFMMPQQYVTNSPHPLRFLLTREH